MHKRIPIFLPWFVATPSHPPLPFPPFSSTRIMRASATFMAAAAALSTVHAGGGGICTDTRCGGAAKKCCEGSPHLQQKGICVGSVDCDACCGWKSAGGGGGGDLSAIRIMPMGDSITLGVGGGGYREDLGGMLGSNATTAGHWSYSGLLYGGGGVHCGYNGQTIQWLEQNIAAKVREKAGVVWKQRTTTKLTPTTRKAFALCRASNRAAPFPPFYIWLMTLVYAGSWGAVLDRSAPGKALQWQNPTHVLIMAGTNDMFFLHDAKAPGVGANATGCVARMEKLIETAFSTLPEVNILLSGVTRINTTLCANYSTAPWNPPNCPSDMQDNILQYNAMMALQVQGWRQQGRRVSFHDPNCLGPDDGTPGVLGRACTSADPLTFNSSADYFTYGIHFSASGYTKMALAWKKALEHSW